MLEPAIFVVVSAGLVRVSWSSLRVIRSHGFHRFFAWEFILALVLLNLKTWFQDPFSAHQLVAWSLLAISLFLVVHGFYLLRVVGKPDEARDEEVPMIGVEKTTTLVTVGAYKYIRHPLYSSMLFFAWGVFFKDPSWIEGVLALMTTVFLVMTAKVEEAENLRYFGSAYQKYMQQTKMFVPLLF
jgi:protein-S-isoprenylcysteine O-methyltransferase Ste14